MANDATNSTSPGSGSRVEELLDALTETRRVVAAAQAQEVALLAEAVTIAQTQASDAGGATASADIPMRSMSAQIGTVWRVSDRTVQRQLSDAVVLAQSFPATLAAWAAGDVSRAHVRVIVDEGLPIDDPEARAVFEAAALEVARRETPGRARPAIRVLANRLHPVPLDQRHTEAAKGRDVWVRDLDDGMAELIAILPAAIAHGIRDRLDQYARRTIDARGGGDTGALDDTDSDGTDHGGDGLLPDERATERPVDTRRIGEVRADVFADLLLTGHATAEVSNASIPENEAIVAQVQVTVPVLTALGGDDQPAELIGKAPIDTATALRLAGTATGWDRVLTHPSPAPSSPSTATGHRTTSNAPSG